MQSRKNKKIFSFLIIISSGFVESDRAKPHYDQIIMKSLQIQWNDKTKRIDGKRTNHPVCGLKLMCKLSDCCYNIFYQFSDYFIQFMLSALCFLSFFAYLLYLFILPLPRISLSLSLSLFPHLFPFLCSPLTATFFTLFVSPPSLSLSFLQWIKTDHRE